MVGMDVGDDKSAQRHAIDASTRHLLDRSVPNVDQQHALRPAQQSGWLAALRIGHRASHGAKGDNLRLRRNGLCLPDAAEAQRCQEDGLRRANHPLGQAGAAAPHRSEPDPNGHADLSRGTKEVLIARGGAKEAEHP